MLWKHGCRAATPPCIARQPTASRSLLARKGCEVSIKELFREVRYNCFALPPSFTELCCPPLRFLVLYCDICISWLSLHIQIRIANHIVGTTNVSSTCALVGRVVPGQGIIFMSFESIQGTFVTTYIIYFINAYNLAHVRASRIGWVESTFFSPSAQ